MDGERPGYVHRLRSFGRNARLYLLYSLLSGFGLGILRLFFNLYVLALGHDTAFLGLLVALPPLVIAVTAVPMGLLGQRIGFRRALLVGGALMIVAMAGVASSTAVPGLVGFALCRGLARTLLQVSNAPFLAENSGPAERTHLFSVQFATRTFSTFFGFLLAGALPGWIAGFLSVGIEDPAAYRGALYVGAAVFLVALLPLVRTEARTVEGEREPRPTVRELFHPSGVLLRLFLPQVIIGLGAGALVPFLNVFFKTKFDVPDALLGAIFAGQSVVMGFATLAGPALADRWGRVRTVVAAQLGSIPFLVLLGYSPLLTPAAVGFLARASLMNLGTPLYTAFAMDRAGSERRATVSGLLQMSWQGTRALSALASGWIQAGAGFGPLFPITIACYLSASSLITLFFLRGRKRGGEPDAGSSPSG
ncbi:MAG: MFS transporter [Candidatus Bipolaricaulota bacterium]|nr:MAG: MFS transporter [Candidatus Bipolaricaulota bacterium]